MLTIFATSDRRGALSDYRVGGSVLGRMEWLLSQLRFKPKANTSRDEAIAILRDGASSPDLREWAERFLCGMTTANAATYLDRRHRWQS